MKDVMMVAMLVLMKVVMMDGLKAVMMVV